MAIVRESATLSSGTENNVCTVNMPATRPDGDLYICFLCKDDTNNVTDPAGWNELVNGDVGTGSGYIGWRIGSSEPATYSWTHGGGSESWNGCVIRYSGVNASTPFGSQTITPGGNAGAGGVTAAFPVITAEESDSKILRICLTDTVVATGYGTGSGTFVTTNTTAGAGWSCVGFGEEDSPGASSNTPATTFTLNTAGDNGVVTLELLADSVDNDIDATGSQAFSTAAAMNATGTLAGTAAATFAGSAVLTAIGQLVAAAALAFTPTADLQAAVGSDIDATAAMTWSASADLDAIGSLAGTGALAWTSSAALSATGALSGTGAATWTSTTDIVYSHVFVELTSINSESDFRITATPDLEIGDHLEARAVGGGAAPDGLTLNADATFEFIGAAEAFDVRVWDPDDGTWGAWATQEVGLLATGAVSFAGSADLDAAGTLAAAGAITWATSADLVADAGISATGAVVWTTDAVLNAPGTLAAASAITWSTSADLIAAEANDISATGASAWTGTADLDAVGTLASTVSVAFTSSADLTGALAYDLSATGQMLFASAADLAALAELSAIGSLSFGHSVLLTQPSLVIMYPNLFVTVAADSSVTSLLGSAPVRFWPFGYVPQGEDRPYAIHQLIAGSPANTLSCVPDIDNFSIQIDAYARTVSDSRAVAEVLRDALETDAHLTAYNGENWEQNTGLYRVSMTFDFWTYR